MFCFHPEKLRFDSDRLPVLSMPPPTWFPRVERGSSFDRLLLSQDLPFGKRRPGPPDIHV